MTPDTSKARFDLTEGAVERWTPKGLGLECMMRPSPMGPLNGYVRLPKSHAYFGRGYDDIPVDAHGGLTYGCDEAGWVGFDTMHLGDWWEPGAIPPNEYDEYDTYLTEMRARDQGHGFPGWTVDRLRVEVERLAYELAVLA